MWTAEYRRVATRRGLRYPSDLTDAEWGFIEPMIPPAKRGGRALRPSARRTGSKILVRLPLTDSNGAARRRTREHLRTPSRRDAF